MSLNTKSLPEKKKITIVVCTVWLVLLVPIIIATVMRDAARANVDTKEEIAALSIERGRQILSFFTGGAIDDLTRQQSVPADVREFLRLESVAKKVNAVCGTLVALYVVVTIPVVLSQLWKA